VVLSNRRRGDGLHALRSLRGRDAQVEVPLQVGEIYLGVVALLSKTAGRPWTFVWIFGLPGVGAAFHFLWCWRHGINPITAEPKDEYYRLRGWTR
jgi:hypothetical protein